MGNDREEPKKKGGIPAWLGIGWLLFLAWIVIYVLRNIGTRPGF